MRRWQIIMSLAYDLLSLRCCISASNVNAFVHNDISTIASVHRYYYDYEYDRARFAYLKSTLVRGHAGHL